MTTIRRTNSDDMTPEAALAWMTSEAVTALVAIADKPVAERSHLVNDLHPGVSTPLLRAGMLEHNDDGSLSLTPFGIEAARIANVELGGSHGTPVLGA